MALSKGTNFDPKLVTDLFNKVRGKSTLAVLSNQQPIPFDGSKEMVFSFDKEIDIVAENGAKSEGGVSVTPVVITPIKFEYGARVSDEFMYASEEERLDILAAFNEGFARKVAKGLDIAAMHGLNPRTGGVSAVIGNNCFDKLVTQSVSYVPATADENLEDAIALVEGSDGDVTGIALSKIMGSDMAKIKANGVSQYPEFKFGGNPDSLAGVALDVNKTISSTTNDRAIVGDFENAFKWGFAKQIPLEVIEYGDPDNSGKDLKGHNQVYIRSEVYLGWGILAPEFFAKIEA